MRLDRTLRLLAPYGLLSAPILLWLLMPGQKIEGIFGNAVLEASVAYLGFGACALVMGKRHPGAAGLLGGLLMLAFVQVEHDHLPGEANLRMAHLHLADSTAPAQQIAADATALGLDFFSLADSGEARMDEVACSIKAQFPYTYQVFNANDTGIAVFSRYPLEALVVKWWAERPHISGRMAHPDGAVAFVAGGGPDSIRAPRRMEQLASQMLEESGPRILLDAFTEMPTGENIAQFKRQTSLRDGRKAWADIHPELAVPISSGMLPDTVDYILHSPEIECIDFQTYESGSLRGVVGTFSLPHRVPAKHPAPSRADS